MDEKKIKVLLIEDDEEDFIIIRDLLRENKEKFTLDWVKNYDAGKKTIYEDKHDIYLIDYHLGEHTGLELIAEVNAHDFAKPVVLLTGIHDPEIDLKAMESGAADFLVKGEFSPSLLERSIRYALERKRAERERVKLVEAQAAQKEAEQFKFFIEGVKDYAITIVDLNGIVTSWNEGGKHIFGYSRGEIIGKHFSLLFTPEDRDLGRPEWEMETALKNGRVINENWSLRKDGRLFWASGVMTPLYEDGRVSGFAKIIRDLTEQKEIELRKNDFISMASHELKTPLTSTKMYMDLLQKRLKGFKDDQANNFLDKVMRQLNRLTKLVSDLLDLSTIEAGKLYLRMERFNLTDLIKEIAADMEDMSTTHKIVVKDHVNLFVRGDRDRIIQVIINLLTNAIKYSPKADKVLVILQKQNDNAVVCVEDFGIGILEEKQRKIFERFYQVSEQKEKTFPGLGMGLYISSRIIERHGGKIWVESKREKGSLFYFSLPLQS